MPQVVTLKNGRTETLWSVNDFIYLLAQHLGYDAVTAFRFYSEQKCTELKEQIAALKDEIESLESDIAALQVELEERKP